jgi:hypothetical protein
MMIKNANSATTELKRHEFEINESLLGDALERNSHTIPPRLMRAALLEHPLSTSVESEIAEDTGNAAQSHAK